MEHLGLSVFFFFDLSYAVGMKGFDSFMELFRASAKWSNLDLGFDRKNLASPADVCIRTVYLVVKRE